MECDCEKPKWKLIMYSGGLGGGDSELYQCNICKTIAIKSPLKELFG